MYLRICKKSYRCRVEVVVYGSGERGNIHFSTSPRYQIMNIDYNNCSVNSKRFDIRDHVEFDQNGRALCPSCSPNHSNNKKTLSLVPNTDGAYKCFRDCSPEEIREALGQPKTKIVPTALAKGKPQRSVTVEEKKIVEYFTNLMSLSDHSLKAIRWLANRGITTDLIKKYKLGLCRAKLKGEKEKMVYAISIPIPSYLGDQYYIKKRIAPWDGEIAKQPGYKAWSQFGIPPVVLFTYLPEKAKETWLCEGEWDAMVLGTLVEQHRDDVAVATFTGGCNNLPSQDWLNKLPGEIKIFYDRNDLPRKDGTRAGEVGAKKVAQALGDRAKIAQVPMPDNCIIKGWDVTDAIQHGYSLESFERAAMNAEEYKPVSANSFLSRTRTLSELYRTAPDYVDWLVEDTLTTNELYCLAAAPRAGKSLLALGLAKAISTGGKFLGRQCQQGEVLYICKEDPDDKVKERLIAQAWETQQMDNVLINRDFVLSDLPELSEYVRERKPALIIMDTLTRIQKNNSVENSSEMTDVLAPLQDLAQNEGVCILVIHHTKKNVPQGLDLLEVFDAVRGSGAIRSTCRGMLVLSPKKNAYRLSIETGRTNPEDLTVVLNPETLIWHCTGDHKPKPINSSHKQQILVELEEHGKGTIDEFHARTGIHRKTIHKILTRLISEGQVERQGRNRNTIYYRTEIGQSSTNNGRVEVCKPDSELDRLRTSPKNKIFENPEKRSHNGKEMLQERDLLPVPQQKKENVELNGGNGSNVASTGDLALHQTSTNHQNVEVSGQKGISGELIHFATFSDTTNFFDEEEKEEEEKEEEGKETEKPTLKGVWHNKLGYVHVLDQKRTKLTVRQSGTRKSQVIYLRGCDSRREYQSYCDL